MSTRPRYPAQLFTLEFTMPLGLPTLVHSFPSEAEARYCLATAIRLMSRNRTAFHQVALYHRNQLLATATPPALPPMPEPDPDGIRRLAEARRQSRSAQMFNSAAWQPPIDESSLPF